MEDVPHVTCLACGRSFRSLNTHLRSHGMRATDYRTRFPGALLIHEEVARVDAEKISAALRGRQRADEHRANISKGRKGVVPKDHPRHVPGAFKMSEETRARMRAAHLGSKKSEETRRKISESNRGRVNRPEAIEKYKETIAKKVADGTLVPPMTGRHHTEETKKVLSEKAKIREASYPKEYKTEQGHRLNRVRKITEETRKKHRENWRAKAHKADGAWWTSQSEDSMAAALDKLGIRYLRQYFVPEIQTDSRGRYHAFDFWLQDMNVLLEVDGAHHHTVWWMAVPEGRTREEMLAEQMRKDAEIDALATGLGYAVVRCQFKNKLKVSDAVEWVRGRLPSA